MSLYKDFVRTKSKDMLVWQGRTWKERHLESDRRKGERKIGTRRRRARMKVETNKLINEN
jgi:hypothetical protein